MGGEPQPEATRRLLSAMRPETGSLAGLAASDASLRRRTLMRLREKMGPAGSERAVRDPDPAVLALAGDPDRNVRAEVIAIVRTWADSLDAGREFVARAIDSPGPHLRLLAVRCWPDAAPVEPLAAALGDPDVAVRRAAARQLVGRCPGALLAASRDPDWVVRTESMRAYWTYGDPPPGLPDVPAHVVAALDDAHEIVRCAAVHAVGCVGGPNAVEPLRRALADPVGSVRSVAVVNLVKVDPEAGFAVAVAALRGPGRGGRVEAAEALGELRDPRAIEPLARLLLETVRVPPRIAAVEALGRIRRVAAVAALAEALLDERSPPALRTAAAAALTRIDSRAAREALHRAAHDG